MAGVEPPTGGKPIVFQPETYDRHDAVVQYVESSVRTRFPRRGTGRFPGVNPGAWGYLASGATITAGSGLTLGTGTVKLCDRTGAATPENADVTAYNTGGSISGPAVVPLEWTGGDWSVCGCSSGCDPAIVHVQACSPRVPVPGVTVNVWTDSSMTTLIVSGTTDSGGNASLDLGSYGAGTWYVEVVASGCLVTNAASLAMTCGDTFIRTVTLAAGCCCPGTSGCNNATAYRAMPLFLTDAFGTWVSYQSGCGQSYSWCCMGSGSPSFGKDGNTPPNCQPGNGTIPYGYSLIYFAGTWTLQRYWQFGAPDVLTTSGYLDSTDSLCTEFGMTTNPPDAGSPTCNFTPSLGVAQAQWTGTHDCHSWSWSGTLTPGTGMPQPDPVGGTVALST
jgi:hypothetical protein